MAPTHQPVDVSRAGLERIAVFGAVQQVSPCAQYESKVYTQTLVVQPGNGSELVPFDPHVQGLDIGRRAGVVVSVVVHRLATDLNGG